MALMLRTLRLVCLVLVQLIAAQWAGAASPWGADYFPNLVVQDQNGRNLRFYDDVLKGKQVVISFIFTSCQDICPLSTARLAQVKDKLGDRMGRDVFFISLTVDPETDTPQRLKDFADAFDAGPGWLFLTGDPKTIRAINSKLGDRSKYPTEHRNEVVLGNEKTGEWARNSALGELDRLTFDILQLDPVWRDTKRVVANDNDQNKSVALSDQPGEVLFRKLCSGCHTVGVGDRVGPDLRDVNARRTTAWLHKFIKAPDKMLKAGDPTALALNRRFPHVVMPSLGLNPTDVDDLISYLAAATERLKAPEEPGHDHASHSHADEKATN
jgi:protein SCO1